MWKGLQVEANHAMAKGGLNGSAIDKIMADTKTILK